MLHVLTQQEFDRGCELLEVWREHNIPLENVYDKSKELNRQGWFTVINCTDHDKEMYEIVVLHKNI